MKVSIYVYYTLLISCSSNNYYYIDNFNIILEFLNAKYKFHSKCFVRHLEFIFNGVQSPNI